MDGNDRAFFWGDRFLNRGGVDVIGDVMTSSPGRSRIDASAMWIELVPDEHGKQYLNG